jgi:hypothetical protein
MTTILDSDAPFGIQNLSYYPDLPAQLAAMEPQVVAYLYSQARPTIPLYRETDHRTVFNFVPYRPVDASGSATSSTSSLIWPMASFKNVFYYLPGGVFSPNPSHRNSNVLHINAQYYTNTITSQNRTSIATLLLSQHSRVRSVQYAGVDPRTHLRNQRESMRYECLLDFQGYQQSQTWDELMQQLLAEGDIEQASASDAAVVRLEIHAEVYSQTLAVGHVFVLPFLVSINGFITPT